MLKQLNGYCQYILPHHFLTNLIGKLANTKTTWLKNFLIKIFCRRYQVNLDEAEHTDINAYATFNQFFTRALKPGARHVDDDQTSVISPVDGTISEIGQIQGNQLLQAKGMYFSLDTLLGNQKDVADQFRDGSFATLYLAPKDYHRVHMPIAGKVNKTIYVPGQLFSVNRMTSEMIPNLYARNERLAIIFDTQYGPMAMIMVGAMIVGSIQTAWQDEPIRDKQMQISTSNGEISLYKGEEVGHFKMGSTVILLFNKEIAEWDASCQPKDSILFGQKLGKLMVS